MSGEILGYVWLIQENRGKRMKPRRVIVELEIETDEDLKNLRDMEYWNNNIHSDEFPYTIVKQVQANVVKK